MFPSKLFVHRVTAFLLFTAAFLAQCALFSHFQKPSQAASSSSGQPYVLVADGTAPPPPQPTPLPKN